MDNTIINFDSVPAKIVCTKCGKEEILLPSKSLKETIKNIDEIKAKHDNCE